MRRLEQSSESIKHHLVKRHGDARFTAIGYLDDRLVTLVFSSLGTEAISAISLRTASNRERKAYAARQE